MNTDWPFGLFLLVELGLIGGTLEGDLDIGGNLHFTDMQIEGFMGGGVAFISEVLTVEVFVCQFLLFW